MKLLTAAGDWRTHVRDEGEVHGKVWLQEYFALLSPDKATYMYDSSIHVILAEFICWTGSNIFALGDLKPHKNLQYIYKRKFQS